MIKLVYPPGATPLDADALKDLIPAIITQGELNEFEARNIADAVQWAARSRKLRKELLLSANLTLLHKRMFNNTWKWAGGFRHVNTNIGVSWEHIRPELQALCADVKYQIERQTYSWDELAVRFHYRLVAIHPFLNGNGRHARLAADLLLMFNNQPELTWGSASLVENTSLRREYISAIHEADKGIIQPLIDFARRSS